MTLFNSGTLRGDAAFGVPSGSVPADGRMEVAAVGGPLKKYEVTTPSGTKTTMKLNEADAKRYGVLEEADVAPEAAPEAEKPAAKARTSARNKARSAANKDGGAGGGDD